MKTKFAILETDGIIGYVFATDSIDALDQAEKRWFLTDSAKAIRCK